ncbi:MAG: hypothetical protein GIW95_07110 [Candidatus Eremiobacteraeota bacterium]|nr:hypothetical protein [Candidatus Eremiobacteraeota bacterium]
MTLSVISAVALIAGADTHARLAELARQTPPVTAPSAEIALRNVRLQLGFSTVTPFFFMWVWSALILASLSRQGPRGFGLYFALAVNASLPMALENVLAGIAIAVHPAESYASLGQLLRAFPDSLAVLRPSGTIQEQAFLSYFSVFQLWNSLLLAYGLHEIGGVRITPALVAAFTLTLAFALLQTAVPSMF